LVTPLNVAIVAGTVAVIALAPVVAPFAALAAIVAYIRKPADNPEVVSKAEPVAEPVAAPAPEIAAAPKEASIPVSEPEPTPGSVAESTHAPDATPSSAEGGKDKGETTPPVPTYTIGGTLNGLAKGASIVVSINGANDQTLTKNGAFTLPGNLPENSSYSLSIVTPPDSQPCTQTYGTGAANSANNSSIDLFCGLMPRDGFAITAKLATARYYHTTTLLADGRALAVGGINNTHHCTCYRRTLRPCCQHLVGS